MVEPPAASAPRPRRRRWRICFAAFGIVLLLGGLWLFLSPDEPPPDVSDLTVKPLNLPDDQNAYLLAIAAGARTNVKQFDSDDDPDGSKLRGMIQGKNWDDALAKKWLEGTEAIWPLWEQAAHTPEGQAPIIRDLKSPFPNLTPIRTLADLAQLRAWELARSGQPDAAIESLFATLQIAQRLQQSRGTIILYVTGMGIKVNVMDSMRGITTEFKPSAAVMRQALQRLEAARPDMDSFANAFRGDFGFFYMSLAMLPEAYAQHPNSAGQRAQMISMRVPLLFKPNQTRRIYAEAMRNMIGAIDRPAMPPGHWQSPEYSGIVESGIHFYSPNNITGRWFLTVTIPAVESVLRSRLKEQSSLSTTEAFLALALYQCDHGNLPDSLATLVPGYLAAVPRDYFSGQPIRYSPTERAAWSVGAKRFDPTALAEQKRHPDPNFGANDQLYLQLTFADPPASPSPASPVPAR